jgi:hypothetical protein
LKSKRYCLQLFAQPDAANSAGADIDLANLFHLPSYLSLAQMRVFQREFQHGLFQIPIGPIFVVMILVNFLAQRVICAQMSASTSYRNFREPHRDLGDGDYFQSPINPSDMIKIAIIM